MVRLILYAILMLFALMLKLVGQDLLFLKPNSLVAIKGDCIVAIDGSLNASSSSTLTQAGDSKIFLTNDLTNDGIISIPTGTITFTGSSSTITGSGSTTFGCFSVTKCDTCPAVLGQNIYVDDEILILQGCLDIGSSTITSSGNGNLLISGGSRLKIAGTGNISGKFLRFTSFSADDESDIEFCGSMQYIEPLPGFAPGYGNLYVSCAGTKYIQSTVTIRGSLINRSPAILHIYPTGVMYIGKNVINDSEIINNGVLEIGK